MTLVSIKKLFDSTASYIENKNRLYGELFNYMDKSYVNISTSISASNSRLLNSTEELWKFNFSLRSFQSIYKPVSFDVKVDYKYQTGSSYIQKMSFVSSSQALSSFSNILSFYSLSNYEYYLEKYLSVKADMVLFGLPEILNFRSTFGIVLSYLHSSPNKDFEGFTPLKKDFWEYGVSLQGLSFLNFF